MKKLIAPAAIAVAAALLLAGCSGGGSTSSSSGGTFTGKPLVVAFPVPLTSGNKATAEQMVNAATLAVNEINAKGGAGGRELVLKTYDDQLTADASAQVTQRALTVDGAEIVAGAYTTIEGLAIRQLTDPRKIVFMSTSTISPALTDGSQYVFRTDHVQSDYPNQMAQAASDLGLKNVLVVHDDSPSGSTLSDPIDQALKAKGVNALAPVGYTLNATDLSSTVATMAGEKPDGVIIVGSSAADAGLMVKTMNEQGLVVPLIGFSSPVAPDALRIGGDAYKTIPVYSIQNKQPDKPLYADFAAKYAAANGGTAAQAAGGLSEAAGETYDGFTFLAKALDVTKGSTDGDALSAALKGIAPFEGVSGKEGGTMSFANSTQAFKDEMVTLKYDPSTQLLVAFKP
ncbi:ABC transporter substrate-binding protein [Subtercola endophyticus]|uniref:ABC transporter substrate-binding protein n=1 Tax=Subtercola endophyticus TaxID=2895559 RepID=UPI001E59E408|nr:ABC transporter substrate-binding protein [Subtercola endophyticus]UFS58335.1 ABC transporter substrate-binding protein [Subtercola endophyticus]